MGRRPPNRHNQRDCRRGIFCLKKFRREKRGAKALLWTYWDDPPSVTPRPIQGCSLGGSRGGRPRQRPNTERLIQVSQTTTCQPYLQEPERSLPTPKGKQWHGLGPSPWRPDPAMDGSQRPRGRGSRCWWALAWPKATAPHHQNALHGCGKGGDAPARRDRTPRGGGGGMAKHPGR